MTPVDGEAQSFRSAAEVRQSEGLVPLATDTVRLPPTVQVIVRMPPELHAAFKARAEAEERSVAAAIRHALRLYLER